MKRNVLSVSLAVLILTGASVPALLAQDAKPFLGDWKGSISVAGMEIEIALHFKLDAEKKIAGTIDVPMQGATGLVLAEIKIEGKTMSFTIPDAPGNATMKGTLDEAGKAITGTLSQGGMEGTFTVTKV
jgi:hypothetical protein